MPKLARWSARELDRATVAATTLYTDASRAGGAGAPRPSGKGRVVYALSVEPFAQRYPHSAAPSVPQDGPAL